MDISVYEYIGLFLLIGFAGFVDSIAGGGGLLTIPAYIAIGLPEHLILGTNKLVSTTGTTIAIGRFIKQKAIHWKLMSLAIAFSMIGAFLGARLSVYLTKEMMLIALMIVVPLILILQRKLDEKGRGSGLGEQNHVSILKAGLIGLVIGTYDGLFGPGTGTFLIIGFVLFLHMNYKQASANARMINYISNISALIFFMGEGRIYWPVALVALCGAVIGNYLGSGLVLKHAEKIVGPVFRLILIGLLIKCAFDLYSQYS